MLNCRCVTQILACSHLLLESVKHEYAHRDMPTQHARTHNTHARTHVRTHTHTHAHFKCIHTYTHAHIHASTPTCKTRDESLCIVTLIRCAKRILPTDFFTGDEPPVVGDVYTGQWNTPSSLTALNGGRAS